MTRPPISAFMREVLDGRIADAKRRLDRIVKALRGERPREVVVPEINGPSLGEA